MYKAVWHKRCHHLVLIVNAIPKSKHLPNALTWVLIWASWASPMFNPLGITWDNISIPLSRSKFSTRFSLWINPLPGLTNGRSANEAMIDLVVIVSWKSCMEQILNPVKLNTDLILYMSWDGSHWYSSIQEYLWPFIPQMGHKNKAKPRRPKRFLKWFLPNRKANTGPPVRSSL